MAEHTTEYASALRNPVRFRLMTALANGPRTLESLASELDTSEATIAEHADVLERLDVVTAAEADGTRMYELRREPILWDTDWAQLPTPLKRSLLASGVTHMAAMATAAVDRGGFDRDDIHLTRTTIRVDEAGWRRLANLLGGTLHDLGDFAEAPEPDGSTGPTFAATAVMMLFTGEQTEVDVPVQAQGHENDALERLWELSEELDAVGTKAVTNWDRIHAVAEELRLIARSMQAAPSTSVEVHD